MSDFEEPAAEEVMAPNKEIQAKTTAKLVRQRLRSANLMLLCSVGLLLADVGYIASRWVRGTFDASTLFLLGVCIVGVFMSWKARKLVVTYMRTFGISPTT